MNLFVVLLVIAQIWLLAAKPYQVPMMGKEGGKRTLVLLDDMALVQTHSIFFGSLTSRGHDVTYIQASAPNLVLKKFGEFLYDNIVFFAPEIEEFNRITFDDISEFLEKGGNILLGANDNISEAVREFAETCGVEFDTKGSSVIDHFSYSSTMDKNLQHTAVVSRSFKSTPILGNFLKASEQNVLFKGIGHAVDENNVLAVKVLLGNPSSYSANPSSPIGDYPENTGADTLLVSAFQARNNARILFSGSTDMFSNAYYRSGSEINNEIFCSDIAAWTFGESGVLRFRDISHSQSDGTPPDVILHEKERPDLPVSLFPDPEITRNSLVYRIKDELTYSMTVEEYAGGKWIPFHADDMQLEFVMLDAHVRKTMKADSESGRFFATFTAPDNYGIFKFRVLYRRPGYSILHTENSVSVRPFKHNEYDRFLLTAYPYYASSFSAMVAFVVFSIFFLYSSDK